jgi:UDP-N-acetylmuramate--alanine ligase
MKKGRIHCIGIGGIGLSALAQYFKHEGYEVSGTDQSDSRVITLLKSKGIDVAIGHHPEFITEDIERVYYTAALSDTDPELIRTQELNIPAYTYAQGLGMISKNKKTIAVAGSHGKTSTTAMIAHILREGKKDPTVIVGSLLGKDGTNFISGTNDLFVVEACEYKKSFLEIDPWIAVVTNIDNDHLDYYGTIENLVAAFKTFVEKVPKDGYIVVDRTLPYMEVILQSVQGTIIDVSERSYDFNLLVPGEHMQKNARLGAVVSELVSIPYTDAKKYLETFAGTWRRSQYVGTTTKGALIFDDYGHHPTEIKVTLKGFKQKYNEKKIIVLFQPHLFSRTKLLFNDFIESFFDVDTVYVAPIYAAREVDSGDISSQMLVSAMQQKGIKAFLYSDEDFKVLTNLTDDSILITLGAGSMNSIGESLSENKI